MAQTTPQLISTAMVQPLTNAVRTSLAAAGLVVSDLEARLERKHGHPLRAIGTRLAFLQTVVVVQGPGAKLYEVGDNDELTPLRSRRRDRFARRK